MAAVFCTLTCFAAGTGIPANAAPKVNRAYYAELQQENQGKKAEKMDFIPTTEQSVIFAFGGLSRLSSVNDILQRMDAAGLKGTFFVTERELQKNGDVINAIVAHGQEIGIGLRPGDQPDTIALCAQIDRIRQTLQKRYGIDARLVRQMYGAESDAVQEAVSIMGCRLIGQTMNAVQSKQKDARSADEVMPILFKRWSTSLGRGQIVYIRTDFYTNETLAGDVMMAIKETKVDNIAYRSYDDTPEDNPANDSAYGVTSVGKVLSNKADLYTYPTDVTTLPEILQPSYVPVKVTDKNFKQEFLKRYVGSPEVDENDRMLGFSRGELRKADKSGIVKTVMDNTIFLTFDDWGNDNSINKLLYVLRKHHVPGMFFIITRNMPDNPNLLRAIALGGNEIGSHTNNHKPMVVRDPKTDKEVPTETPEVYNTDVTSSYQKLAQTVGDVVVNGRHPLTRLFRPPTLAISKSGAEAIMNAGFTYMVSGYDSTEDYEAVSLQQLVGKMQLGIYDTKGRVRKGAILVMHMSDTAKLTPRALDLLLTANEKRPDYDPKKFKVGYLSDYLRGDYSQMMKTKQYP